MQEENQMVETEDDYIRIKIYPQRKMFYSDESYFGIYACGVKDEDKSKVKLNSYNNIVVKGTIPEFMIDREYTVDVVEDIDDRYGLGYIIENIKPNYPSPGKDQLAFMKEILTDSQLKNIYDRYSYETDIIALIQQNIFDYESIKGLGEKSYKKLVDKIFTNIEISEAIVYFSKYDIPHSSIISFCKKYEDPQIAIATVKKNPYLLTELQGVGFKKADYIASRLGIKRESPLRIEAGINFCILEESNKGNSWVDYKKLVDISINLLKIGKGYIEEYLKYGDEEKIDKRIVNINGKIAKAYVYDAEKIIADKIKEMNTNKDKIFEDDELSEILDKYCKENNVQLEDNQRKFFFDWNSNGVMALVGGGGTGKTWLTNILLDIIDEKNLLVDLMSPTGRAAKVLSKYTGREASTIHRAIGLKETGESRATILSDVIIVDEASMCDIFILRALFEAIKIMKGEEVLEEYGREYTPRILFIGDDFQLPSVGVGNFLFDVINCQEIVTTRLTKTFRQKDNGILQSATNIRNGISFLDNYHMGRTVFGNDCVFWMTEQEYVKDGVIENYKKVIKKYNEEDIAILSPTKKGNLGTVALNRRLQEIANPRSLTKEEFEFGREDNKTIFRVDDLVMNLTNTYNLKTKNGDKLVSIFNGDIGRIKSIDTVAKKVVVDIDNYHIEMDIKDFKESFIHSWAMTIHKSQGDQFKVVIVVADYSSTFQLNANLLYTGFSRAQEYMLVLGQSNTINRAMRKKANFDRRSFLEDLL